MRCWDITERKVVITGGTETYSIHPTAAEEFVTMREPVAQQVKKAAE